MTKKIKMLDAFAGIGGFHLGVQQACDELNIDFECVGAIEFDNQAQKTYISNFPNVSLFNDITKIKLEELPNHNILCGGFPCPSFSRNNTSRFQKLQSVTQCDTDDERLFLYKKLLKILLIHQPQYFIFENVAQLAKMEINKQNVANIIVNSLNKLNYNTYVKILDAADFGVPQQRKRIYFVGILNNNNNKNTFNFPIGQTRTTSVRDILVSPSNVNSKYYIKNAWKNRKMKNGELRIDYLYQHAKNKFRKGKISPISTIGGETPSGSSRQHDRVYSIDGISRTLATFGHPAFNTEPEWRMLTPREFARLQGFPDNFNIHDNDNVAMKQFGNAVCVNVVKEIVKNLIGE